MNRPRARPFVFAVIGCRLLILSHRRSWHIRKLLNEETQTR